jgi:glycosyltransferase involved in cell wall biosynthesis
MRRGAGVERRREVRFLDAVDDGALSTLHQRAAIVAVPSVNVTCSGRRVAVSEPLGPTAIEAMSSGAPVVASHLGGLRVTRATVPTSDPLDVCVSE